MPTCLKHTFLCRLSAFSSGVNQWRDQLTPRQLLLRVCERWNLPMPVYQEDTVHFRGDQYTAADLGEGHASKPPNIRKYSCLQCLHCQVMMGCD